MSEDLQGVYNKAVWLINGGQVEQAHDLVQRLVNELPEDEAVNLTAGVYLLKIRNHVQARNFFKKTLELNPANLSARYYDTVCLLADGSHRSVAEGRDDLFKLLEEEPEIEAGTHRLSVQVLHQLAHCCTMVGPRDQALRFRRRLAELTGKAGEYFELSEICALTDHLEEAEAALRKAIELDPGKYDIPTHRHTLELLEGSRAEKAARRPTKKCRYPDTEVFRGDLETLICDHLATEHKNAPKFIGRDTRFFTMGSCFARNISNALTDEGYDATHMEISEYINTTFANRCFVDYLEDALPDDAVRERIAELLPEGFSKEEILEKIKHTDVFILTLGVAPAFFDRRTGAYMMPRPSGLNQRALAEKYVFRTTSVQENVDNVLYLLSFIRKLAPSVRIVVTVSPVPLHMTFEFDSAIQADCLSKSVMRLTAQEVVANRGLNDIYYWPSFEFFRWAGSHAGPYFATDDGAAWHVSEAAVHTIIQSFLKLFGRNGG